MVPSMLYMLQHMSCLIVSISQLANCVYLRHSVPSRDGDDGCACGLQCTDGFNDMILLFQITVRDLDLALMTVTATTVVRWGPFGRLQRRVRAFRNAFFLFPPPRTPTPGGPICDDSDTTRCRLDSASAQAPMRRRWGTSTGEHLPTIYILSPSCFTDTGISVFSGGTQMETRNVIWRGFLHDFSLSSRCCSHIKLE